MRGSGRHQPSKEFNPSTIYRLLSGLRRRAAGKAFLSHTVKRSASSWDLLWKTRKAALNSTQSGISQCEHLSRHNLRRMSKTSGDTASTGICASVRTYTEGTSEVQCLKCSMGTSEPEQSRQNTTKEHLYSRQRRITHDKMRICGTKLKM